MKPEDWRQAMENEAASVEHEGWARETRRLARRHRWLADALLSLGAASILAGVWMTALVLISRFAWHMDRNPFGAWAIVHPARFDLVFLGLLITFGLCLGWCGVRPARVALVLALLPLLLWLVGRSVYVEGVWNDPSVKFDQSFTADFVEYPLNLSRLRIAAAGALFGFLGAWGGNVIRRKRALANHRQSDHPTR